ncbi:MAG: tyrosine recombinase XerC [Gammaproteobacteria bacterium]|nr:tyrosine recombinase XerC [Gammaproteobacteria bacterium]
MATLTDWLTRFSAHLAHERRLSAHTVAAYTRDLAAFRQYCAQQGIADWNDVDLHHVRAFTSARHRRGLAPHSIQRSLACIRTFYNYLLRETAVRNNPANGVRAPKASKRLPVILDPDQMAKLLENPGNKPEDLRDHAVMELLYSSGLRLAELISLDLNDVDSGDATVRVIGKGSKTRIVPVGRHALSALSAWLQVRAQIAKPEDTALFTATRGGRLSPRTVQTRMRRWGIAQGVQQGVHPHLFRHSFASHLLESSGDLRAVQELLGHANISTTQVYTHLDFQHLARTYDSAHPRAKKRRPDR